MERDIIIIGGGPGGYTAAIRAAQLGAAVTIVEADKFGGACLHRGCIPTKALYRSAQIISDLKRSDEFGIHVTDFMPDMPRMLERKQQIVGRLETGIIQLLNANAVEMVRGRARFTDAHSIEVTSGEAGPLKLSGKNIIIATGSSPSVLPIPGIDLAGVMTSDEILSADSIPGELAIIGGGVIGIEFAGIFSALGSKVTVLEFMPRILPVMDDEISKKMTLMLRKRGILIHSATQVNEIRKTDNGLSVIAREKGEEISVSADTVLVSTGRTPNIQGLNLESTGIAFGSKGIKVDMNYRTNVSGLYAIGDVTGGRMLAHVAAEEGKAAVENVMGFVTHVNYKAVPSCIFSFPEAAAVGLTAEEAESEGASVLTGKFLFGANGKALTSGDEEGFVKVFSDTATKKVLGVHILGPHASDLIHEAALAIENGLTAMDIMRTVHAHPTYSEAFAEAALGTEGRAIHLMPSRKR